MPDTPGTLGTLEPACAGEVYESELLPPTRSKLRRYSFGALDLWCAMFGGLFELSAGGEVVVRRRADGVEELRIPVTGTEEAGLLLTMVREQLAELTPAEFRSTWSVD
ncbi:hypothetical protein [Nocardioides sp.]|uniref:hypothetical protein n=1 Tax=Nocardioides sp. TaxID=35761 RepID=UPI002B26B997|nr:hypothetical protein [Nocardioides sp.]